jgi:ATP-binding cassette subfamily B protein/subfamily B ATP-binding cassette protein MsbA
MPLTTSRQRQFVFKESADKSNKPSADKVKRRKYLREYARWLWPYRFFLLGVFLLAVAGAALDLVWPLAIKGMINGVSTFSANPKRTLHQLNLLGISVLVVLLLKQAIDSFRGYRTQLLNAKVIFHLRSSLFNRLLNLPVNDLGDLKTGGIVSRLSSDIDSITGLVQSAIISPAVAAMRIVLTLGILLYLSWHLAVVALILLPPIATASMLWTRRVRPLYRSVHQERTETDGTVGETFGGIRIVRAFRRENAARRAYAVAHHTIIRKSLRAQRMDLSLEAIWGIMIPLTNLLIVWYGGSLVMRGKLHVGDIFAFQIYSMLLLNPVWSMVQSISSTQKSLAAMERVFDVMNMAIDKPDLPEAIEAPATVDEIEFDRVGFEYRAGTPVIENFSLVIPGGSTVALVGPSGAGKTTLTDLIARFHDPTSGAILLNGTDLRKMKLASYRRLLAVVQQETFLFDGTVAENGRN